MGACFSKCGGKYLVRKDDSGNKEKAASSDYEGAADTGSTPMLVNKVEHNSSFKDADAAAEKTNGAGDVGMNGTTKVKEKEADSSSSSSEDSEKEDKVTIHLKKLVSAKFRTIFVVFII
jgi:hypothetical protein